VKTVPDLGVQGWADVNRLDVRPRRGMVKVDRTKLGLFLPAGLVLLLLWLSGLRMFLVPLAARRRVAKAKARVF
jgi:hypothetical protein